ncbi:GNAT family N-acetyltransferase [Gymnodinialimonas ceratoperidinii]|uniref:GNAT family N-acetyltransferase n=1 Tax=Gymnodinialimonas ceratoperidinii TaxID=2856823 RepID=A0A8F6YBB7_9RHOB|nr:GNAT family N-acetyltransferase [Gymnodinialimonas ceratoperidinii]QXT39906.1 GNAT family N-acetyltransferase [Gymnodinialimonas ceratoperidinii]
MSTVIPAGTQVPFTITYLEMPERPSFKPAQLPGDVRLERAIDPPVWYFLSLYDAVGREYEWQDRFEQAEEDPEALQAFVRSPDVVIWTAIRNGFPHGFFVLDWRAPGACDLAYFGLVPQAVGSGIGPALLQTAIATGWAREGTEKMTVNTCSLDHPAALRLYQKMGFHPVRREERTRVLTYDRVE